MNKNVQEGIDNCKEFIDAVCQDLKPGHTIEATAVLTTDFESVQVAIDGDGHELFILAAFVLDACLAMKTPAQRDSLMRSFRRLVAHAQQARIMNKVEVGCYK